MDSTERERDAVAAHRDETPDERADRNWNELLQELRVMQTGAQIFAAFLMTLPFHPRFSDLAQWQHVIYLVLLVSAALVVAVIMTPVVIHRSLFRRAVKAQTVTWGHRLVRVAAVGIGLVVCLAVFLIVTVVATVEAAFWIGGLLLVATLGLLVAAPAAIRRRSVT
ncbi:DUF6328 family protein [Zhihengliuella flava]|uniref:Sodium:proton antiporter n=1 Tax=Zhihengliuella flava TaxID=1285193 RepID=A0A931D9X5_9MICC|nr:DUF6328 family protein [Zhihengliuella flava]MBG6085044.1 hypothetical protein [Zhihengliuella flava]